MTTQNIVELIRSLEGPSVLEIKDPPDTLTTDLEQKLRQMGYAIFVLDRTEPVVDKASLINALKEECSFPGFFGNNWDAVADSLSDFSWLNASGYVLLLTSSSEIHQNDPQSYEMFLGIIKDVNRTWKSEEIPFKLIVFEVS